MGVKRLYKLRGETIKEVRSSSLKLFIKFYEQIDSGLANWVFAAVRIPYLSVIFNIIQLFRF